MIILLQNFNLHMSTDLLKFILIYKEYIVSELIKIRQRILKNTEPQKLEQSTVKLFITQNFKEFIKKTRPRNL